MMWRRHIDDRLASYAHGELPAPDAAHVEAHLRRCPRCRGAWAGIRNGLQDLSALPRASAADPDALWQRIEAAVDHAPTAASFAPRPQPRRTIALVAATALALMLLVFHLYRPASQPAITPPAITPPAITSPAQPASAGAGWQVVRLSGAPTVDRCQVPKAGELCTGQWLETDRSSRARVAIADIGHMQVEPGTRLRLLRSRSNEHRLQLARGTVQASVTAPPRLFLVETPAAVAVDMGCAYTLSVDGAGGSVLRVTAGQVDLEWQGHVSTVLSGLRCEARPGSPPGTPCAVDAPRPLREALHRLDFGGAGPDDLTTVLAEARPRDAYTVWHRLSRAPAGDRARITSRLQELSPPPPGVTLEGATRLDPTMLAAWGRSIEQAHWSDVLKQMGWDVQRE